MAAEDSGKHEHNETNGTDSARVGTCFLSLHARYGSEVISVMGPEGNLLYESDSIERLLGYRHAEEALSSGEYSQDSLRYIHPDDKPAVARAAEACFVTPGESPPVEYRIQDASGEWRWFESRGVNLFDDPEVRGLVVSTRDITERKRAEQKLKESERRFKQLFEFSVDAMVVHDPDGNVVDANRKALDSLGYSRGELLSMEVSDYETRLLTPGEREEKESAGGTLWQRISASEPGEIVGAHEGEHVTKSGATFPVEVRVGGVDYGGQRMILSSIRDITGRRTLEERLSHQASHDPLTGLANRELVTDKLRSALARSQRSGERLAVLFVDVDNLKLVNDSLGHEAGDRLLVSVGERLRGRVREGDAVARFGGDEFLILLEDLESSGAEEEALLVVSRILDTLEDPLRVSGYEVPITISVGVAVGPHPGEGSAADNPAAGSSSSSSSSSEKEQSVEANDSAGATAEGFTEVAEGEAKNAEDLIRHADAAMYRAKSSGGAGYAVFEPDMGREDLERLELSSDLHHAIERGELRTYYQHKVDLSTGKVAGWEALLRWEHPERGRIEPDKFIPLAEDNGLIVPIGKWVLEEACEQARVWRERHPRVAGEPGQFMSVNLSPRQFADPDLEGEIERILERSGLPAYALDLEITERVLIEDEVMNFARIRKLKEVGLSFSLDDFGTGYSSLSSLKELPVDFIKIDRSFIDGIPGAPQDEAFVTAMVSLAHALGLRVVAEGIETKAQRQRLEELGCDHGQGYYFAPPRAVEDASRGMERLEEQAGDL